MVAEQKCIFCDSEVSTGEASCSYCGYLLRQGMPAAGTTEGKDHPDFKDGELRHDMEDIGKLDRKSGNSKGCFGPLIKIVLLLFLIGLLLFFLFFSEFSPFKIVDEATPPGLTVGSGDPDPERPAVTNGEEQVKDEDHQPATELPDELEDEGDLEDNEAQEPDYELLEPVLKEWLSTRLDDPAVVLIPEEEMDQLDPDFLADYDPDEDNVLVYRVERREDLMVNVYFGLPFSEWTRRTVFTWDGNTWIFIQEVEL